MMATRWEPAAPPPPPSAIDPESSETAHRLEVEPAAAAGEEPVPAADPLGALPADGRAAPGVAAGEPSSDGLGLEAAVPLLALEDVGDGDGPLPVAEHPVSSTARVTIAIVGGRNRALGVVMLFSVQPTRERDDG
jgi:hypothetical protein